MSTTKDRVLALLREDKIKLWLPPYRELPTRGGGPNREALTKLAESLREKIAAARDENAHDGKVDGTPREEILDVLLELQQHAVQKLREKNSVAIKILATERHLGALPKEEDGNVATAAFPASWGEEVKASTTGNVKGLRVQIAGVSPTLTVTDFSSDLCRIMDAKSVRIIWKGKNILASGDGGTLQKIVCGDKAQSAEKKKSELLCLVSGFGYVPPAAAAASQSTSSTDQTESDIIASIRQAAQTLQNSSGGSRFEITDQNGNLVPMQQNDMVAFLTALGLHRIGRSRMEKKDDAIAMETGDSTGEGGSGRDGIASALAFLLEADAEWNNSPALDSWRERCDNYGLLQLDIAWCFLLLESLDDLADAVRRLAIAEKVLQKQVNANFVTLALAQAEMDHGIPPLCSIFVRLFLLQGVANKMQNCNATAEERLGWARLLCNRLRSTCPADSVDNLCNAYLVDPPTAIAALRRSNGDPDAAGNLITQSRDEEKAAAKKRRRQHRMGKCANGSDFVNFDLAPTLSNLLGYGDVMANISNHDDGRGAALEDLSTSALIVIGLLRLSDNDIDRALQLYSEIGAEQVFDRVARLDEASGRNRKQKSKKRERERQTEHEVQDVDLTMLVSLGVDEELGREALRATGNVESAILWLSRDGDAEGAADDAIAADDEEQLARNESESNVGENGVARSSSESDESTSNSEGSEIDDAHELLERELGNALGADSKQMLEKEWLGIDLQAEWELIEKYI